MTNRQKMTTLKISLPVTARLCDVCPRLATVSTHSIKMSSNKESTFRKDQLVT